LCFMLTYHYFAHFNPLILHTQYEHRQ
jgi:hypothetical protein